MAKAKIRQEKPNCEDCRHSYDPHSKALDGHFILIRCRFEKWSKFLKRDGCSKFQPKQ